MASIAITILVVLLVCVGFAGILTLLSPSKAASAQSTTPPQPTYSQIATCMNQNMGWNLSGNTVRNLQCTELGSDLCQMYWACQGT